MKNNVYSCKLLFYYIKVGFKEVKITVYRHVFVMTSSQQNHVICYKLKSMHQEFGTSQNITKTRLYNLDPLKPHFNTFASARRF